jgi:hypothetical protein
MKRQDIFYIQRAHAESECSLCQYEVEALIRP